MSEWFWAVAVVCIAGIGALILWLAPGDYPDDEEDDDS